jgi:hypothetical protein
MKVGQYWNDYGVKSACARLSNAQLLAMYGAPIRIVGTPASNEIIAVVNAGYIYKFGTIAFPFGHVILAYGGDPAARAWQAYEDTIALPKSGASAGYGLIEMASTDLADLQGAPLTVTSETQLIDGDGSIVLWVAYLVVKTDA